MRSCLFLLTCLLALPAYAKDVHWTYDGDQNSQEDWAVLSKDFAACNGTAQSPIQINFTTRKKLPPLELRYGPSPAEVFHNGHAMEVAIKGENMLDGTWRLDSIVMHTPSEHTVHNRYWPMEIEFIHHNFHGDALILSAFGEKKTENPALAGILKLAPPKPGNSIEFTFNPATLLPKTRGYFAYTGSLTTPPCTEGVEWRILKEPIPMSQEQLVQLGKLSSRNARLPQPVYMREIKESMD